MSNRVFAYNDNARLMFSAPNFEGGRYDKLADPDNRFGTLFMYVLTDLDGWNNPSGWYIDSDEFGKLTIPVKCDNEEHGIVPEQPYRDITDILWKHYCSLHNIPREINER